MNGLWVSTRTTMYKTFIPESKWELFISVPMMTLLHPRYLLEPLLFALILTVIFKLNTMKNFGFFFLAFLFTKLYEYLSLFTFFDSSITSPMRSLLSIISKGQETFYNEIAFALVNEIPFFISYLVFLGLFCLAFKFLEKRLLKNEYL